MRYDIDIWTRGAKYVRCTCAVLGAFLRPHSQRNLTRKFQPKRTSGNSYLKKDVTEQGTKFSFENLALNDMKCIYKI